MTAIILSALFKLPQKDEEDDDDEEEAFAGSAGLYHCKRPIILRLWLGPILFRINKWIEVKV